ncbi:hypothetical protein EMCRGX_G028584 [Ephydatia muelleri]
MAEQSDAFKQLDAVGKSRYNEKLGMLGITTDPYMTPKDAWDYNLSRWPDVSFPDICVYFIHTPSPYTKDELKAYKSTEAWAYFTAGYVKHSQKMTSPPLRPWIGVQYDGTCSLQLYGRCWGSLFPCGSFALCCDGKG